MKDRSRLCLLITPFQTHYDMNDCDELERGITKFLEKDNKEPKLKSNIKRKNQSTKNNYFPTRLIGLNTDRPMTNERKVVFDKHLLVALST